MAKTYYTFANGCRCEELFNFAQDSTDWLPDPKKFLGCGLGNQFSDSQLEAGVKEKIKGHSWAYFDLCMEKVFRVTDGQYVFEARTNPKVAHSMISRDGCFDDDHIFERLIENALDNIRTYPVEETLTQEEYEIRKRDEALSLLRYFPGDVSVAIEKEEFQYFPTFVEDATHINRADSFSLIRSAEVSIGFRSFASVPIEISSSGFGKNTRQWSKPCVVVHYEDARFNGGFPLRESEYPEAFELLKDYVEVKLQNKKDFLIDVFKDKRNLLLRHHPNEFSLPKPFCQYEYIDSAGVKHSEALPCVPCRSEAEINEWLKCVALTRLPDADEYEKAREERLDPTKNNAVHQLIARSFNQIAVTDGKTVFRADASPYTFFSDEYADIVCNLWIHHKESYAVVGTKQLGRNNTQTIESSRVKSR